MRSFALFALALVPVMVAGCTADDNDIVGPYTGPVHRFVVAGIELPRTNVRARELGDDLDGDGEVDNVLGYAISALDSYDNITTYSDDMIASGAIASVVEIQADSLDDDPTVSVRYIGRDGDAAVEVGGSIEAGVFRSNRTATTHVPGRAILRLPVFADAAPSVITLDGVEMDFHREDGGLYLGVRGGVGPEVRDETARGVIQLVEAKPQAHPVVIALFDANTDGTITPDEVTSSGLIKSLLAPDVRLRPDGGAYAERVSFGFAVHLIPCDAGNCALAAPEHTCFDRVLDGDETDIDCGGSCMPCATQGTCADAGDCQSQSCVTPDAEADGGRCAAPTCSDGVRDGYETDVDCGWNCTACARGQHCERPVDCASEICTTNSVCG